MVENFFYNAMLKSLDFSIQGESSIKLFYKFPLGFFFLNNLKLAENIYYHVIHQSPNEDLREFNTYYDCWLYLYTKLTGNKNSCLHYDKIIKNRTHSDGFSALPNGDPEIRATAISSLCAFLEQDFHIVKSAAELLCYIYDLNQSKDKFYFILNKDQKLITEFPLEHERRFVFETQKARPLLYSFPLSVIALLATFFVTQKRKYLDYAKKYAEKILKTDFRNDYCGKSAIAMSILYFFTGKKIYLEMSKSLSAYIEETLYCKNTFIHNNNKITVDRLSEYAIGLEFCKFAKDKKLPTNLIKILNNLKEEK